MSKKVSALLRIIISFGLLGFLFWIMRNEVRGVWSILSAANPRYLFIAALLLLINVAFLGYRLKIIFLGETLELTFNKALQLTCIGYFFNNFMPTAVGGDVVKAHYAANDNKKRIQSYASVMMDRFIGLYSFLIVAAIALVVDKGQFLKQAKVLVFVLLAIGMLGFFVATNRTVAAFMGRFFMKLKMFRLGEHLNAIYDIVHDYRNRGDVVLKSFMVSMVAQCLYFVVVYLFFIALETRVSLGNIFLIMPVVTFISMVPSVGGLGVREGAIVAFFSPFVGKETAFAVSLLLLFGLFFISIIGGIIYFWWGLNMTAKEKRGDGQRNPENNGLSGM